MCKKNTMLSTVDKANLITKNMTTTQDDDLESQMKYVRLVDDGFIYTHKQKIEDINKAYMTICLAIIFVPLIFLVIILITHYLR